MNEELLEQLRGGLRVKTLEIEAAVAKHLGLSGSDAKSEAEELIEGFEESLLNGATPREWEAQEAHERKVTATPIGRLLRERYEIGERIVDIQDRQLLDDNDDGV